MKQTIRLGRVAGIPVGVHWSVLVIAALLTQGLAMSFLPASAPGQPRWLYWLVAALAAAELTALGVPVDPSRRPPAPRDETGRQTRHVDSLMS